jgi:prepilin-type N-terminal cleavage/methylation domain-containing protein
MLDLTAAVSIYGRNQTILTSWQPDEMTRQSRRERRGFTLVETMIVVTIIALLAAIAMPNIKRARERSQGTRMLEDLRLLNAAVDQYAIDNNKTRGQKYAWTDLQAYIKTGTQLYAAFQANGRGPTDLLGNRYRSTRIIDEPPAGIGDISLNPSTFTVLSDVAPADFWSPYGVW